MSHNNKRIIVFFVLLLFASHADKLVAAQAKKSGPDLQQQILADPANITRLLKQGKLSTNQIPNPHWKANACTACHKNTNAASRKNLRDKNIDRMCNTCHESLSAHTYIHVSDINVPKDMQKRMPNGFLKALEPGSHNMTCTTCHDLPMTCKKSRVKEKGMNPMFFRGGPYESRTAICYHCHDVKKYQRVNAHDQINDKGELQKEKCLICHTTNKDLLQAKSIDEVEFNLKDNLVQLCWGCHLWKPHPGGSFTFFSGKGGEPDHLVKPSVAILKRMQEMQKENDIVFPLEPGTGTVFCGTCHNPHERGVIKVEQAAKGADSKKRLRMQEICVNCHDK